MSKVEQLLVPEFVELKAACDLDLEHIGDIEYKRITALSKKYRLDSNMLYDLYANFLNYC